MDIKKDNMQKNRIMKHMSQIITQNFLSVSSWIINSTFIIWYDVVLNGLEETI